MAKKSRQQADDSVRAKAAAMREAQEKAERRARNIIFAVVGVVVVALVIAIAVVVTSDKGAKPQSGDGAVPAKYATGEPIYISHLGVGERDPELEDLTVYASFTCGACTILEVSAGADLARAAENGDFNLIIQPVATSVMPYLFSATNASLQVAANAPEKFTAFYQALFAFSNQQLMASDTNVIGNARASLEEVRTIAAGVGVPEDVIAQFSSDAETYLTLSTEAWTNRAVIGRGDRAGTPEIVFRDTKIEWTQGEGTTSYDSIIAGMTSLGYVPGEPAGSK